MAPKSAYRLRVRLDAASFCAASDAALDDRRRRALDTAIHRALHGTATTVFYRGRQSGERRRYNDALLIAASRRLDPAAPSPSLDSSTSPRDAL